jgi:hypothetical protein
MNKVIFEDKERELTIIEYGDKNVVVKYGALEISMNKDRQFQDTAYMVCGEGCPGITFDYDHDDNAKWLVSQNINMISLWYLIEAKRKLEVLKESYQILKEED